MIKTILGKSGIETGIIGLGLEHLEKSDIKDVQSTVEAALDAGASYMDLFMSSAAIRDHMGSIMKGRRSRFQIQGHLGACLSDSGQYYRSRDPVEAERHAEDLLRRLGTDYIDTLMLHFVDEAEEWNEVVAPGGTLDIALKWKKEGKARAVGMSSHKVFSSAAAAGCGLIDILMFPVNPSFDMLPGETRLEALWEADPYRDLSLAGGQPVYTRRDLYLACERNDVSVIAMKPYAAGWAFRPDNPSGIVLTPVQCLEYCLSQPGVSAVVPGCKNANEVYSALAWLTASQAEKDYSQALKNSNWQLTGKCMYCNHCLPCPSNIDIAATTRLLDSAKSLHVTPSLATSYQRLPAPASACINCGSCEQRCPFDVAVEANMAATAAMFE